MQIIKIYKQLEKYFIPDLAESILNYLAPDLDQIEAIKIRLDYNSEIATELYIRDRNLHDRFKTQYLDLLDTKGLLSLAKIQMYDGHDLYERQKKDLPKFKSSSDLMAFIKTIVDLTDPYTFSEIYRTDMDTKFNQEQLREIIEKNVLNLPDIFNQTVLEHLDRFELERNQELAYHARMDSIRSKKL